MKESGKKEKCGGRWIERVKCEGWKGRSEGDGREELLWKRGGYEGGNVCGRDEVEVNVEEGE